MGDNILSIKQKETKEKNKYKWKKEQIMLNGCN